jgi:hypothetical protein
MSSLLEEAIVDARALKEAALKNAENIVLEKYSGEVRKALDTLLEQEDSRRRHTIRVYKRGSLRISERRVRCS